MDKRKQKLQEAWANMESLVSPTPIEGPAIVEEKGLDLSKLKDLIKIEDLDTDVYIKLGWMTLIVISEDEGKWFPMVGKREISTFGFNTKQEAIDHLVNYFGKE